MKLVCEACGHKGPLAATSIEDKLFVRCGRCGKRSELMLVSMRQHARLSMPQNLPYKTGKVDAPRCPKCRSEYGDRASCPGCGLSVMKMASYAETMNDVPDDLRAAWEAVEAAWDDVARHDRFIQLSAAHGTFAWSAGQYHDVLASRPKDERATRGVERLRRTAEAAMLATAATRAEKRPYRTTMVILVIMVIVVMSGITFVTALHESNPRRKSGAGTSTPAVPLAPSRP